LYLFCNQKGYKAAALTADTRISISIWKRKEMSIQYDGGIGGYRYLTSWQTNELADAAAREGDFWPPVLNHRIGLRDV
jgi:hypothetical protein